MYIYIYIYTFNRNINRNNMHVKKKFLLYVIQLARGVLLK